MKPATTPGDLWKSIIDCRLHVPLILANIYYRMITINYASRHTLPEQRWLLLMQVNSAYCKFLAKAPLVFFVWVRPH
jgi:hypothetical protein